MLAGCTNSPSKHITLTKTDTPVVVQKPEEPQKPVIIHKEEGIASWYGGKFNNRKTASGERFNQNAITAAHKTLPLGTKVIVTNIDNGKQLVIKINDRGPYSKNRILDVSKQAAVKLGMIERGTSRITLEVPKDLPVEVAEAQ